VREHDQPRLHTRRRQVWLGLLVTIALPLSGLARGQEVAGEQAISDPIELAARQVQEWESAGEHWALLWGDAAILQGSEGVRARSAVVHIIEVNLDGAKAYQADVYAEGDVRLTGADRRPRSTHRTFFRTATQVQLRAYRRSGYTQLSKPPLGLKILDRAGFPASESVRARMKGEGSTSLASAETDPRAVPDLQAVPDPQAVPNQDVAPATNPVSAQVSRPSGEVNSSAWLPPLQPAAASSSPKRDPEVQPARLEPRGDPPAQTAPSSSEPAAPLVPTQAQVASPATPDENQPPSIELPPIDGAQEVEVPNLRNPDDVPRSVPLPGPSSDQPAAPIRSDSPRRSPAASTPAPARAPTAPILPGTQRVVSFFPRSNRRGDVTETDQPDGTKVIVYRGGLNIIVTTPQWGIVDIESESAVVWRHPDPQPGESRRGPNGELIEKASQPMEVYLEGNVILRQDENKIAGKGDQRTYRASRAFYDFVTDRMVALDAEANIFAPGFIAPMKLKSPRIEQFHKLLQRPDGTLVLDPNPEIRAERTIMTGSRFPNPAYQINNRSVDLTRTAQPLTDPNSGRQIGNPNDPDAPMDLLWHYDARQNFFYMGRIPVFYWPRLTGDADDLESPLRQFSFRSNNYFGQQILSDWNGFKILGIRRPPWIDNWNLDLDYLSARTKRFPALGSEMGWFGNDLIRDLTDPYHKLPAPEKSFTYDYFGYFDIWGLRDYGNDVLGSGPAIVTNGPAGAGKRGYQRSDVPPFQQVRGRFNFRHMQRFLPEDDEHHFEDLRLQLEVAYVSDRYFLEEYYKRLTENGMDQETLAYMQWQKNNTAWNLWGEVNLQNFYTDTQWLPRLDYYRLGDSLLSNWLSYSQHSGVDYATIHTDIMVNNPNLFAFIPYDPISNTSGVFSAFRAYTNHELSMPMNIYDVVRVVPYLQGQIVGWSNQLGGGPFNQQSTGPMARFWGAAGVHTEMTAWKVYPDVENELLNIHGLNNKMSFFADFRAAFANQRLNSIAVQDDLDDNWYEYVRRYFAITSWTGGILPFPYDPRHLILRRALSPITGPTDIQASITTLQLGIHQRLQTKRGPEGKRRIVDWMTLDVTGTYFPDSQRDNFGKPWGQTMYNYQWFVGDRTSIISYGWFDFWNLVGSQVLSNYNVPGFNPKGLNVITTGISLSRPPRANVFIGYTVINSGPIQTSALNTSLSYWLSPKWYGSFSTSYDFGNKILLGSMFSLTRIGADYLTSVGLSVDPQRQSYMFAFQISPRLSPNLRLGSGVGLNQFDSRYAPTQ
jgi:hypothetical protein